ncbi:FMN-binding protein [Mesorhizobium helmanticense]|uniref:FMN-binding protein n=1 Tax=Mesorhizobium helmanticense TaxID=1776423 RepID=UPI001FE06798|nr:FMN-binding protein [Mesorhizobium helmanticense]
MKQIALSLFVIAASGAYVWVQAGNPPADDALDSALPANAAVVPATQPNVAPRSAASPAIRALPEPIETPRRTQFPVAREVTAGIAAPGEKPRFPETPAAIPAASPHEAAPVVSASAPQAASFAATPAVYIPIPQPRPAYPNAPARVIRTGMKLAAHGYADGVYTGPAADAYYGIIQIQALVQGGQLRALKVLKYPSDRRTSVSINRQACPCCATKRSAPKVPMST